MKYTCQTVSGKGRGKTLGFPTFNLQIPQDFSIKPGIYAAWVWIKNHKYPGALHFGPIPAFEDSQIYLEVFVLNYSSSSPVAKLSFQLVKRLRSIRNFSSSSSLKTQISRDVDQVRILLQSSPSRVA